MEYVLLPNLIDKKLTITVPKELRDGIWSREFGLIQNQIKSLIGRFNYIQFDFCNVYWIDPLPILHTFLYIGELRDNEKIEVEFVFTIKEFKQCRVLTFLLNEGFIDEMFRLKYMINIDGNQYKKNGIENLLSENQKSLLFKDALLISPTIYELPADTNEQSIRKYIDTIIEQIQHRIIKKTANSSKIVQNNLRQLLFETIVNVYEHAYEKGINVKSFGIYARFRQGLADPNLSNKIKQNLSSELSKIQFDNNRNRREFVEEVSGYIEYFIIDNGIGIVDSYTKDNNPQSDTKNNIKRKFREVWEDVFRHGTRNKNKDKPTMYGGLFVIGRIISKGFILGKDYFEWIGEYLPIKSQSHTALNIADSNSGIKGFALIAKLAWFSNTNKHPKWSTVGECINYRFDKKHPFLTSLKNKKDIYQKYYHKKYKNFESNPFYIRDDRFKDFSLNLPKNYLKNTNSDNFILWLPEEGLQKYEIFNIVNSDFTTVRNSSLCLIIADIPDQEIDTYQYSIQSAKFDKAININIQKIILVSRNLSLLILISKEKEFKVTFEECAELIEDYIETIIPHFNPSISFVCLLDWLRSYDSLLFWLNIFNKNSSLNFFVNGNIVWYSGEDKVQLNSYFNFSQTLSDFFSLTLYDISLNRAMSLSNKEGYRFIGADNMTKQLSESANSKVYENFSNQGSIIRLGSVFVTGNTHNHILGLDNNSDIYTIDFFYNQSSLVNQKNEIDVNHLFIWPDLNFIEKHIPKSNVDFRRVGNLPVIAPNGWKYYTVPRYICNLNDYKRTPIAELPISVLSGDNFSSSTISTPKETFLDWQTNDFITFGHFENHSYHDFLKIDIPFFFDESLLFYGNFFLYLLTEFMQSLGEDVDDLIIENDVLRQKILKYIDTNNIKINKNKSGFVVYPYHYSTDYIVKKLALYFDRSTQERIIPLTIINNNSLSSPYLLSYQTIQQIRTLSQKLNLSNGKSENKSYCLFFDSLKINLKIEREILHILDICDIDEIQVLHIIERSRLPIHPSSYITRKPYWRIDVPILGNKDNCLICSSLDKANNLKLSLNSKIINEQLDSWNKRWGKSPKYDFQTNSHGIKGSTINLKNSKKKFGVYIDANGSTQQIGGESNKIELLNSIGIAIYSSEINSMTTRDNCCLDFCLEDNIEPKIEIEILAASLILQNGIISDYTRKKIVKKLFSLCKNINICSAQTSLAAIALLNEEIIPDDDFFHWSIEEGDTIPTILNLDILIFLCYRSIRNKNSKLNELPIVKRLLKSNNDAKNIYKDFHSELYNDFGKPHNTPLQTFQNEGIIHSGSDLLQCSFSLNKLYELFKSQLTYHLDNDETILYTRENFKNIRQQIQYIEEKVQESYSKENDYLRNNVNVYDEIITPITSVIFFFEKVHSSLFSKVYDLYRDKSNSKIWTTLLKTCTTQSKILQKNILIDELDMIFEVNEITIKEKWITWNSQIHKILINLISNSQHIKISNVIEHTDNSTGKKIDAHMIVSLEFDNNYFTLKFKNRINQLFGDIKNRIDKKTRVENIFLKEINGSISYFCTKDSKSDILIAELKIPII